MAQIAFAVLGDVRAAREGVPVQIRGRRERTVLAALLAARGGVVGIGRLLDDLWGPEAGPAATSALQVTMSRIRAQLEPDRAPRDAGGLIVTSDAGYALRAERVDVDDFERGADAAMAALAAARPEEALEQADAALALWRGTPYDGVPDVGPVAAERGRLVDLHLAVLETRAEAALALGRHAAVAAELLPLVAAHPFRERLWELAALAHYRSARQAEALDLLRRARRTLADELGIDPSAALQRLETRMLEQDPALLQRPDAAPAPRAAHPAHAVRVPIGRDAEFAQLRAVLTESARGATRFVVVEGEPGIGKTRLLEALGEHAAATGATPAWGRCADSEAVPAYAPWVDVLRDLALPAEVRSVFGAEPDGAGTPASRRFRLFDLVTDALREGAAEQPLVLLLEDLHWADPASAELLTHLATRLHDVPLLVVVSMRELELGRDDAVAAAVSAIVRSAGSRRIPLRALPPAASGALLAEVTDGRVDPEVAAAIHRRGDGNPFCMGELARLLAADGMLGDASAVAAAHVPAAVRDVVRRRLAHLPPATRALLEVAAVIGREADLPTLIAASGESAEDCLDALEPALVQHVLVPVPEAPGRHRFAHALVADAALAECSSLRASRLHVRVARALAGQGGDAEVVAGHLWAAGAVVPSAELAEALEGAAAIAVRRTAYERADALLERALEARRVGTAAGTPEAFEAEILTALQLAHLRRSTSGYTAALESVPFDRVERSAMTLGRADLMMTLLHLQWGAAATSCRVPEATALAERMLELGRDAPDPVVRLVAHHAWAVQCWHLARLQEGAAEAALVTELVGTLDEDGLRRLARFDEPAQFAAFPLLIQDLAGTVDDAEARFAALLERFPGPYAVLTVGNFFGHALQVTDRPDRALAWFRRHGFSAEPDLRYGMFASSTAAYIGWALVMTGDREQGLPVLEAAMRRYAAVGARTAYGAFAASRVQVLLEVGRSPEELRAEVEEDVRIVAASGEPYSAGYLDLARARIELADGDRGAASRWAARAAESARAAGNARFAEAVQRFVEEHDLSGALVG